MYLTDMFIMIIRHQTYGQEKYWLPANNEFLYFHLFYLYYISTKYQIICNFIKAEGYDILYKNKHVPTLDVLIPHYKAQYCDSKQRIPVLTLDISIPHYKSQYCASKQRIHVLTLGISVPDFNTAVSRCCNNQWLIRIWQKQAGFHSLRVTFELMQKVS